MARIKRHLNARNHQGIKHRRRKSDIPELVYKFLVASGAVRGAAQRSGFASATKCRCCDREVVRHVPDEVVESADSPRIPGSAMGDRSGGRRSRTGRITKPAQRGLKGRSVDLPISYLQDCVGSEGMRRAKRYIKKALDFGIEAGYLIPSDSAYKILRVSSGLMKSNSRRSRYVCDKELSQERDKGSRDVSPSRLEDLQVQEQRRRRRRRRGRGRRRRRRSRSDSLRRRSRRRRRRRRRRLRSRSRTGDREDRKRYRSPQNPEETVEDNEANDYEMEENEPKGDNRADDADDRDDRKTARPKPPDDEKRSPKKDEEKSGSDLSVDEDETDDEEERRSASATTKS